MIHNSTDEFDELQAKLAQAEFAVQRAEQLALAGRFAAAAVHDINNPLEAISNLTYLLRTEPLSEASAKYLDVMEEQLDRARGVTQQILKLHRAAQRTSRENLVALIEVAVRTFSKQISDKHIALALEMPQTADCDVYPGELTQAFSNLISNAVEASEPGGRLQLRLRLSAGKAHITVRDFGAGVPKPIRETLFEAFVTSKESGNGLGLWICRRVVEKHGGRLLWRTSTRPGKSGTTFRVSLDRCQA